MKGFQKALAFLLLINAGRAALSEERTFQLAENRSRISFESEAPLENIEGAAKSMSGMMILQSQSDSILLSGEVSVEAASLTTGLSLRDEHLRSPDWLAAQQHPAIRFTALTTDRVSLTKKGTSRWSGILKGRFHLKGHTKDIAVPMTAELKSTGTKEELRLSGQFNVRLADYGIHGPPAMKMIGVKVGESVTVKLKLVGTPVSR